MEGFWKAVEGFDRYIVSDQGRVSGEIGGIVQEYLAPNGYKWVKLRDRRGRHEMWVHELVAAAFVPITRGVNFVHHKNGDLLDNCADNLEWVWVTEKRGFTGMVHKWLKWFKGFIKGSR